MTRGEKKLGLFGRAVYEDIFGRQHKSTWLYWFDTLKRSEDLLRDHFTTM